MKILHTADWHLGKIVHFIHMTEDQRYILNQFIDIVKETDPDVIIIAGDLYDRSIPPKDAVHLLNDTLTILTQELGKPVLAISGNHDSPDRLQFGSRLFRSQGLYLETKLSPSRMPVTLHDEHGPVHFHLIPYVEPAEVATLFEDETIRTHQQAAEALIEDISSRFSMEERHIWIGHAFLAGGMESESEERLSMIGGSPYVDAHLFEPFTYVALGHLHQPQRVTKDSIRYSGSLLKYSFSEANHKKSVTLIDIGPNGMEALEKYPLKPNRDFEVIEGYFDELLKGTAATSKENYIHVQLLDDGQILDPMNKLRQVYPHILHLERKRSQKSEHPQQIDKAKLTMERSYEDLFVSFYEEIKGEPISEERRNMVLDTIQSLKEAERKK